MNKVKVGLKSGKSGKPVALSLSGMGVDDAPASFYNYYELKKNYSEIPATPLAYARLSAWATEHNAELEPVPAVQRFLEKETGRREYCSQFENVLLTPKVIEGLYAHQVTAVQRAAMNSFYRAGKDETTAPVRLLLADDPRLGKSAEALRILKANSEHGFVLILCPKALIEQWVDYVDRWLPYSIVNTLKGTAKERLEDLNRTIYDYSSSMHKSNRHVVIITNWETLHMTTVLSTLQKLGLEALIGDEAHKLKNRKSQVRTAVSSLNVKHMLLLSATFTENWPSDYWSPLNLIEPDVFSSYWRFAGFFIDSRNGDWGIEFQKPKDSDILKDMLQPWVIQRRSDDVADMPEKIYENVVCELNKEHRAFYNEMVAKMRVELSEGHITMVNKVSKIMRLRQAVIHPLLIDPGATYDFNTGKFETLKTLMENFVPEGEQVLIYSNFIKSCEIAASVLSDYRPVVFAGEHGTPTDIEKFQRGEYKVFIATPQKGGVGLNLFNANYLIYVDQPWSTITLRQSEERVRAIGKQGPVYIIKLEALDTIDEYVKEVVDAKMAHITETEVIDRVIKELMSDE